MSWLTGILEKWGLIKNEDQLDASTEDALRIHGHLIELTRNVAHKRKESNEALRKSISVARQRAAAFGLRRHHH